ncbi:Proline--tRNA ligase, chloroplastic/mitochondrial [Stylosanthes scabra]|uniref:proline--tRNA ligase n=1 Tax=Stylosanthes scabra TaxID=79078 RepID=A0ABU6ZMP7_9FABA|nr:Proline--tRNA ligase, chloroplastic/mitochondrial [Stylosanthes scabra]
MAVPLRLTHLFSSPSSLPTLRRRRLHGTLLRTPTLAASFSAQRAEAASAKTQDNSKSSKGSEQVITPRSQDFNAWYLDVIANAELADYGPVRGTMVIRPYGYAIWESIQEYLNLKFKETGHSNMYFPQFIPYSFIEKEASHVEGFSPELALVTIGGGKELEEKLVWANVTRWEMRTKPFVRTLEFLWQEGHTAHATPQEAENEAVQMIDIYTKFAYEQAAIPVIAGRKSKVETFAGANKTYTIEAMMGDKKALQAGTSHNLGQNFSRAFETQVVIVPIWKKDEEKVAVLSAASSVKEVLHLAGIKVKLDDSEQRTPGWKFNFWEMKGVPLRIEIGPRDVSSGSVVISRRDVPGKQGKVFGISMEPSILVAFVKDRLDEIQSSLLERAIAFRDSNIVDVNSYDDLKAAISQGKWARGPWSATNEDELKVKEETGATIRCFPFEQPEGIKRCFMTGDPAEEVAIFAKSY